MPVCQTYRHAIIVFVCAVISCENQLSVLLICRMWQAQGGYQFYMTIFYIEYIQFYIIMCTMYTYILLILSLLTPRLGVT